jgi:hypothetical protein
MPIQRDVPIEWDALPDPEPPPAPSRAPRPSATVIALSEADRIELDTLRYNRDHYKTLALRLKTQLDGAEKKLAMCKCQSASLTPRKR